MAYKRDNMIYGSLDNKIHGSSDDSYNTNMAQAYDASQGANQDAQGWKLLADQAIKDDSMYTTNEGDAYRQKELLAVRARKKKIVQEIDELKKELQQRTQLQAYEDRYKDSPMWKLAKKQYIDTGDLSPIESFVTRENALEESMKTRDFTAIENELNRKNTLELNRAQKDEQAEYEYDVAQKDVELAMRELKNAKNSALEPEIEKAKINYNYAVKKLNKYSNKLGKGDSEYKLESLKAPDNTTDINHRTVEAIKADIPDKNRYKTKLEKEAAMNEIKAHPEYNSNKDLIDAYANIRDTKTTEENNDEYKKAKAKAQAIWDNLEPVDKAAYQSGAKMYDKNDPVHRLLNKFAATFGIKWNGGK